MKNAKLPSNKVMLFNGAAILIAAGSLLAVLRNTLFEKTVTPCGERYAQGTRLSLDHGGEPLSPAELQGRLGNTDWGLLAGARVVKLKSGPAKHAIEIDLATAPSAGPQGSGDHRVGVGFTWKPNSMEQPTGACLAYSIYIPDSFAFGKGGRLPGLMGGTPSSTENEVTPWQFSTRFTWDAKGDGNFFTQLPEVAAGRPMIGGRRDFTLPRGRWVELEQEVVLNTPGKKNGQLRAWVDGTLAFQRNDIMFRRKPSVQLSGVLAETVAGELPAGTARGAAKIWMTPFELRWQ